MSWVQTRINYSRGMFCFSLQGAAPQFTRSYADKKWWRTIIKKKLLEGRAEWPRVSLGFRRRRPGRPLWGRQQRDMRLVPEFSGAVGGKRVHHDMSTREAVLRTEGEPRGIGSCLDVPAREARVSETDRARQLQSSPSSSPEGLPGGQMLLLEEYSPWLGIWVQRFPCQEERRGGKGRAVPAF